VTEKLNPENKKQVSQVIVEHPALETFKNISLVDTPGLGSLYKHNSEVTRQWLPFTGIAIVSISAERPLSEEDITLIKGIAKYCPEIAIVITKADLFDEMELNEIQIYISVYLAKATGRNIPVYIYSIQHNNPEYHNTLISNLIQPLNSNSGNKINEIIHHKIRNVIEQSLVYADLALQTARKREKEKDSVIKLLEDIRSDRRSRIR
jgi:signal recognition particle receptor subunit beta